MGGKNSGRKGPTGKKMGGFLTLTLPLEIKQKIEKIASERNVTVSWLVREMLTASLNRGK